MSAKNISDSSLPFVFLSENNYPAFSPVNNAKGNINNDFMKQNQNKNLLFSKNNKKNKKPKKNIDKKYKDMRPSDWICNRCDNLNYSFRTFCNICSLPKSQNIFYNPSMRNSK